MAVNRMVHTIPFGGFSNASAQAVVDTFRQMLIDQGMMTEWHDAWNVANNRGGYNYFRVLKLVQDANKVYGTTYLLFTSCYAQNDAYLRLGFTFSTGGWNVTSHTTIGTQYLDYFSNPSSTYYWDSVPRTVVNFSNAAEEIKIISYKSGNTLVFFVRGYTGLYVLQSSIDTQPSWVNLDKFCVPPCFAINGAVGNNSNHYRLLYFEWVYQLRRMVFPGRTPTGTSATYFNNRLITTAYYYLGNHPTVENLGLWGNVLDPNVADYTGAGWGGAIRMPWSDNSLMVSPTEAPWGPILTGINMCPPLNLKLPSDFCFATLPSQHNCKGGTALDRIDVSPTEKWEIIGIVSTSWTPNSAYVMARIV